MLKEESRSKSLGEQTKRVILVLSDGNDELRLNDEGTPFTQYSRITENLLLGQEEQTTDTYPYFMSKPPKKLTSNINVCDRIRNKLDEHNEDKNTKIVFVEFGYASKAKQAWQHCVGNGNYYSANDKASLLNSFKQAIGETDDVGRSIN
ncbi:tight adherence protein G [Actinobacillus pleuropneumoniae]|nr:tight adherence protein G [Actinobacillus pleuropneumoniae]